MSEGLHPGCDAAEAGGTLGGAGSPEPLAGLTTAASSLALLLVRGRAAEGWVEAGLGVLDAMAPSL